VISDTLLQIRQQMGGDVSNESLAKVRKRRLAKPG